MRYNYQQACKNLKVGLWSADYTTKLITIDDNLQSLLGIDSAEISFETYLKWVIPSERSGVEEVINALPDTTELSRRVTLSLPHGIFYTNIILGPQDQSSNLPSIEGYLHIEDLERVRARKKVRDFDDFFSAIADFAKIGYSNVNIINNKGFAIGHWFCNMGEEPSVGVGGVVGKYNHLHPDDRVMMMDTDEQMRQGKIRSAIHEIRVMDGSSWRWVCYNTLVTAYDPENKIVEVMGISLDITNYKAMEQSLTEAIGEAEAAVAARNLILNNLSSALIYVDTDFVVQWESTKSLDSWFGNNCFKSGEVCFKSAFARDNPCDNCSLIKMFASHKTELHHIEIEGRTAEIVCNPLFDTQGKFLGGVMKIDDITELKRAEQTLIQAKELAEQSNLLKSTFLANMSHEIRTPLNAIVGFSDLLMSEPSDSPDRDEYISIIRRNNELLLNLISDILDLSRIESRMVTFNMVEVNLHELCTGIALAGALKAMSGVKVSMADNLPDLTLRSDENRLHQVISNLVGNATKFTTNGTIKLGYKLLNDSEIEIYVEDTGMGIPEDKISTIFDRFVKLNTMIPGTGLGLAICKNIVVQLGGRIGVESQEGIGSRFWVTLPING